MSLKQIKEEDRILFLNKFMIELLKSSVQEHEANKKIEIEKLRQKFTKPIEPEEPFKKMIKNEIFIPSLYEIETKKQEQKKPKLKISRFKEIEKPVGRTPIIHRIKINKQRPFQKLRRFISKKPKKIQPKTKIPPRIQALIKIQPEAQQRPEGFFLGKLEPLIKDPSIQSIECPNPNKKLLIKRYNKANTTRITLNQTEITDIINAFSKQAKIPITGGVLKAAVGDLVISAVVSEFIGSRFIINKITPYSLINK